MLMAIPNFEGYSIDDETGLVYSHKSQKYLPMKPNRKGYGRTELYNKGKRKHIFNHIKVVEVHGDSKGNRIPAGWKTIINRGMSIDHLNANKMDPSRKNLELIRHSENVQRHYERAMNTECVIPDL